MPQVTEVTACQPHGARDVLRSFGDPERVERTARTGFLANAADILGETNEPSGLLGTKGRP